MTQHTPGPWDYVAPTKHHGPYITSEFGTTIADFYTMTLPNVLSTANGGPSKPVHFMAEMAEHNARLAAASPDLLEALKAYQTAVAAGIDADPALWSRAALLTEAAIAKAEGR